MTAKRKLPFQQVYWDSYVNHPQLRLCSLAARGLWPDIIKLCWEDGAPHYRCLINGKSPTLAQFVSIVGQPAEMVQAALAELEANGVFDRNGAGQIVCRRMVNDEAKRKRRAGEPDEQTEQNAVTIAAEASLRLLDAEVQRQEKLAKQRARQARYKKRKGAAASLEQMRAFAAMETAAALSASAGVSADVSGCVRLTSPAVDMTRQQASASVSLSEQNQSDDADLAPWSRVQSPDSRFIQPLPAVTGPARSLATLTGVDRADGGAGPLALQPPTPAPVVVRKPLRTPSETDEAYAARCATAAAVVAERRERRRA